MHVALLTNAAWLDEELSSFKHLVVGLIDEQVRVAQVVPERLPAEEASVFGERVLWKESRWPLLNTRRIIRLSGVVEELGIDLIHAMDGRLWQGAAQLGTRLNLPVIFTANAYHDLSLVPRIGRAMSVGRTAFTATTEPLAQAIRDRLDPAFTVHTIPSGTHAGEGIRRREATDALCAVVTGKGGMDDHYHALLEGMATFTRIYPDAQFFFDGRGNDQHHIWQAASKLGLLPNMSLVPRRIGHRELLVRADALIQPQPFGASRSLTIEAMAHGVPIIAHDDPWLDYLIDEQTAWVVSTPDPDQWASCLRRLVEQPHATQELGRRAQAWVRQHRLISQQVGQILDLYRRITGETIKFPAESA